MAGEDADLVLHLALLDGARDRVRSAWGRADLIAVERAELEYVALALRACERAREVGLPEPEGLRSEATKILQRYETR